MATVRDLIKHLNEIENKNQTVIFQYYLAEHFWFDDSQPTAKQFEQTAEALDNLELWHETDNTINDYLANLVFNQENEGQNGK